MTNEWRLQRTAELREWYVRHATSEDAASLLQRIMLAGVVTEMRQLMGKPLALEWLSSEINNNMSILDRFT